MTELSNKFTNDINEKLKEPVKFETVKYGDTFLVDYTIMNPTNTIELDDLKNILKTAPKIEGDVGVCISGTGPKWVDQALTYKYLKKYPNLKFVSIFDPSKNSWDKKKDEIIEDAGECNVSGSRVKAHAVGSSVTVPLPESLKKARKLKIGKVIGIFGDPNSGKSILNSLLIKEMKERELSVYRVECDLASATPEWFLKGDQARVAGAYREREKKPYISAMTERVCQDIEPLKKKYDYILLDLGGGQPHLGRRVTPEMKPMLKNVDKAVILCPDGKQECYDGWTSDIEKASVDFNKKINIIRYCEANLTGKSSVSDTHDLRKCTFGDLTRFNFPNNFSKSTIRSANTLINDIIFKK